MIAVRGSISSRRAGIGPQWSGFRTGFTLIELLVVVAIIALLISILLPSLRAARRQAKLTLCGTNLRQLAVAWEMYLTDHDGSFLQYRLGEQPGNWNVNFGGQQGAFGTFYAVPKPLNRYVDLPATVGSWDPSDVERRVRLDQSAEVFKCPADSGGDNVEPSHFEYYGNSYQTNLFMIGPIGVRPLSGDPIVDVIRELNKKMPGMKRSQVTTDSSLLVLMGDYGWINTMTFSSRKRIEWHGEACSHNLAFMDGHVAFTRVRKGLHVTDEYITIPFRDLAYQAAELQEELDCE